jgi:tyrosine-protein phosphatase SIW14
LILGLPSFAGSTCGIRNSDQVDSHVYRGGQPTTDQFGCLAKLGVRTVVDLREAGTRAKTEAGVVRSDGMKYLNVPMTGLAPPTDAQITQILVTLECSKTGPVFVHCWRGSDRTGVVIAAYRIDHEHWDNARALKDAKAHKMGFFQFPRENYIKHFRPLNKQANAAPHSGRSQAADSAASTPASARARH